MPMDKDTVTVGELIAALQRFPLDMRVTYQDSELDWCNPLIIRFYNYKSTYDPEIRISDYPEESFTSGHLVITNHLVKAAAGRMGGNVTDEA